MINLKSVEELFKQAQPIEIDIALEKEFNDYMREAIRTSQKNRHQATIAASQVVLTR